MRTADPEWMVVRRKVRSNGSLLSQEERPVPTLIPAEVPDPKHIKFTTTVYDRDGRPDRQFVRVEPDAQERERLWKECAAALSKSIPQVKPRSAPKNVADDLCAEIPIGDHHFGMYAWAPEAGEDYDLKKAQDILYRAVSHFMALGEPAGTCLIESLGDFLHYDSKTPETSRAKHRLDTDTRFQKMVEIGVSAFRFMIEVALVRHGTVRVIVAGGNHDDACATMLRVALAHIYEHEPRVSIDLSASDYFYFEFGKCLVGVNHGHNVKMESLPMIMAEDMPQAWGRTLYRYWRTGHVHHANKYAVPVGMDIKRTMVESFRVLAPNEAYASQAGYRSHQDMQMILLHREFGEIKRHTFPSRMFSYSQDAAL